MEIKTIVIDDEPLAREELEYLLKNYSEIKVVDSCKNAFDAIKSINKHKPQLIFLDIHMPQLNGFEMLSMIDKANMPYVVFATAYDEHAIKAFEEKLVDYLLKPIDKKRLDLTIKKVNELISKGEFSKLNLNPIKKIPCSLNNIVKLIDIKDIDYIVSDFSGVHVVCEDNIFLTDLTLKILEERTDLFRCHRQYLLNLDHIQEIHLQDNGAAEITTKSKTFVPVSRRSLKHLKQYLGLC